MHDAEFCGKLPDDQKEKWLYDLQTAVNDISVMAAQGYDNALELDPPERCLFYALAELYRKHGVGELSTDECKQLKSVAIKQYEKDRSLLVSYEKQIIDHAKMWNRIEHASTVYAKSNNRTPEADAFFEAVYGCKLKPVTPTQVEQSANMTLDNGYSNEPLRCGQCHCYLPREQRCAMIDRHQKPDDLCYYKQKKGSD